MKKCIILVLSLVCTLLLFSCKNTDSTDPTAKPDPTATTAEATPTAEPTAAPTPSPTKEPAATVEPGKETYAGSVDPSKGLGVNLSPTTGTIKDEMLTDSLATQFFATTTFNKLDVNCVSYGNNIGRLTFTLYRWMGSYYATLESEPVATKEYVDFNDNSVLSFPLQEALPDGEYLIVLTSENPDEGVGVYTNEDTDASDLKTRFYKNDEVVEGSGMYMAIHYTKTPTNVAGPLQDPGF